MPRFTKDELAVARMALGRLLDGDDDDLGKDADVLGLPLPQYKAAVRGALYKTGGMP